MIQKLFLRPGDAQMLKVELLNDPAVSFLHQDIGHSYFFAVEASDITGKGCRIVVHLSREKFTRVIVGDDRTALHHLLKRFERKASLPRNHQARPHVIKIKTRSFFHEMSSTAGTVLFSEMLRDAD